MTKAQRRGRNEISSQPLHVIRNCENGGNVQTRLAAIVTCRARCDFFPALIYYLIAVVITVPSKRQCISSKYFYIILPPSLHSDRITTESFSHTKKIFVWHLTCLKAAIDAIHSIPLQRRGVISTNEMLAEVSKRYWAKNKDVFIFPIVTCTGGHQQD
jgi:hypothetical protein